MSARKKLHVARDFSFPLDAQTSTTVVYGGKGMGKTNFGSVYVEELARLRLRFSVIDPLDVWWGVQHGGTKSTPGLDVVILGGRHGDLPLEPGAGAVVADFVADEEVSTVIVLRKATGEMWKAKERIRFVTDYTRRLFARQGERRIPLLQVIDGAGRFCPQIAGKGDFEIANCISAIEELVEWGRNVGVGVCLLTQRSARMAKSVSELADCMIAFRTVGPRSISAIVDWFGEHIPKARHHELVERLRTLERGSALVVSPGWLGFEGVAHIRARETFDSSATPKPGKTLRAPGKATKPDLEKYRERMAETIERAEQKDPKALQRRIGELQSQVAARLKEVDEGLVVELRTQLAGALSSDAAVRKQNDELRYHLDQIGIQVKAREARIIEALEPIGRAAAATREIVSETLDFDVPPRVELAKPDPKPKAAAPLPARARQRRPLERARRQSGGAPGGDFDGNLKRGWRVVLTAVAQHPDGVTREQLSILTGYKRSSRDTYLQKLRERSLIYQEASNIHATDAGVAALGDDFEPLPTGNALIAHWLEKLPAGERSCFECVIGAWPGSITKDEISEATEYKRSSRDTYLQRLRARQLVVVTRGSVRAAPSLFLEAA